VKLHEAMASGWFGGCSAAHEAVPETAMAPSHSMPFELGLTYVMFYVRDVHVPADAAPHSRCIDDAVYHKPWIYDGFKDPLHST
jgi:hypothetical protein